MREKKGIVERVKGALGRVPASGFASPDPDVVYDVPIIPLMDCWELYKRDATCRSSVNMLAAALVGMGFYTSSASEADYVNAKKAKVAVDAYCGTPPKGINLDGKLNHMSKRLVACGNVFWLKIGTDIFRLPLDAVEKILMENVSTDIKIPYKIVGYKLSSKYGRATLKPEVIIHWKFDEDDDSAGFGIGLMQTLLLTLQIQGTERRPSYAAMKAKIESIMPRIFEKYAGPDVLACLPDAKDETISKFQAAIRNRKKEGVWLFYTGKNKNGDSNVSVNPVQIDPRGRFEAYIDHMINQFYLGCQTPLPRLFSTPGFTEASANAAKDLQDILIKPTQREIKRTVESVIFAPAVTAVSLDADLAAIRLNWGSPETPKMVMADLITAATPSAGGVALIRPEEFRKNAVKAGWELWDPKPAAAGYSNPSGGGGGG